MESQHLRSQSNIAHNDYKDSILVHICCSVDSHYFLRCLREAYPHSELLGYFYNPNIHPKAEYDLRLLDVRRSCKMLDIALVEGEYHIDDWFNGVKGLESAPEKGERCVKCFDMRLEQTAQLAKKMGFKTFTSTLLSSPMKEQTILFAEGENIALQHGLEFIKIDVRSNGGTQAQSTLANQDRLYRQNYCGCQFALAKQRAAKEQLPLELISHIGRQIQPASNEARMAVFNKRNMCEQNGEDYILCKHSKLIWRNLRSVCYDERRAIDTYIITHSRSKNMIKTSNILYIKREIPNLCGERVYVNVGYSKRDECVFLDIEDTNKILISSYQNVREMVYNAPRFEDEMTLRQLVCGIDSLNPIIIIDKRINHSLKVLINAYFEECSVFTLITNKE